VSALLDLSYVVPIRWQGGDQRDELAGYLARTSPHCAELIVVDGSPPAVFAANARAFGGNVRHVAPAAEESCLMGKVAGVRTGVRLATREKVVVADDDVRYDLEGLRRIVRLLEEHDLVWPQNYFERLPWHARWDTARTLLNRSVGRDFPGTVGVRRSRMLAMGLYDGDVLFENLELIRTVRAHGGRTVAPLDLYVARVPPSASHFWGQRTRQAYDDFALPLRMALWLAVVPLLARCLARRRPAAAPAAVALSVAAAERGRRRAGGRGYFPATSSLLAPVWILERGVCAWLAVLQRLRFGGVCYGESVIPLAAHSERQLRQRFRERGRGSGEPGSEGGWSRRSNGEPPPISTASKTPASTGTWSRPNPD
jgi:hypothetical protein